MRIFIAYMLGSSGLDFGESAASEVSTLNYILRERKRMVTMVSDEVDEKERRGSKSRFG